MPRGLVERGVDRSSFMKSSEALIIVDLQRAFQVPPKIVAGIRRFSRRFPRRIFTRFVNPPGSKFRRLFDLDCCAPGSEDIELLIPPGKGDLVFAKQRYGLSASQLARLKRLGVKRVTVCGVETDACVLAVMFSLFDAGIECRVKPKLCWSSTGRHRDALKIIRTQFPS
jgi:nicotinamidase-related amidase